MCFVWFLEWTAIIFQNNIKKLIFLMEKYCMYVCLYVFEVGSEFLYELRASKR
jgi:hypothetical protein